jgi:hypothetical protein
MDVIRFVGPIEPATKCGLSVNSYQQLGVRRRIRIEFVNQIFQIIICHSIVVPEKSIGFYDISNSA